MSELYEEATMSIEELITRYGKRIKDSVDGSEGNSKGLSLDLISKMCAKGRKQKNKSDAPVDKVEDNSAKAVEDKPSSEKEHREKSEDETVKINSPIKLENQVPEVQKETNGKTQNGSDNHENDHSNKTNDVPVSVKGKGVGKGLSNSIRKTVEKTPEEIEIERREAEKNTKRQERKKSLRSKSADELYK